MIHEVNENLSWGDLFSVLEAAETFEAVLNVGRAIKDHPLPGTEYKLMHFEDQDPFPCDDIWECILWIDHKITEGKCVYVHCHQGNSRSVSIIVAYLHYKGMAFEDAFDLVLKIKPLCTIAGKTTDTPLPVRAWFVRDWPKFVETKTKPDQSKF